jgi:stage IV sporulation protein A
MESNLYRDIAGRCNGDIYIGVVGPVRTGKSTFIKRFMDLVVLPGIEDENRRERAVDELPQSGAGKTIMTTQPSFVPDEAVQVRLRDNASFRVRLVDCVGYLVRGVLGLDEGESARMVRTPWFDHDIPFERAAELGTRKVIQDHSTLGVLVTTDGSIVDLPRTAYVEAEERVVRELKALGKPFMVLLNAAQPESAEAQALRASLEEKYDVPVMAADATQMSLDDMNGLLEKLLFEFPLAEAQLSMPEWMTALPDDHYLIQSVMASAGKAAGEMKRLRDHDRLREVFGQNEFIRSASAEDIRLGEGSLAYRIQPKDGLFYQVLSELSGTEVTGEEHLMKLMTELVGAKREYDRVAQALASVRETGYGLVAPEMAELTLEQPEIVRQGGAFGVKLRASAPSLHMIRVDIKTEVSPTVGSEHQSEELINYLLSGFEGDPASLWESNLFGRSLGELVREGLAGKLTRMPEDVRSKVQDTLEKIINDGSGGMICILL